MKERLPRVAGWPRLMNEHITQSQRRYLDEGLQWGAFDCCTFVFDWVEKITNLDPMADYRGRYASREEAIRMFWETGDKTLEGALTRVFGEPVAPALGQRGDIAFRREEPALGIVIAQGVHQCGLFLGDGGFSIVDMKSISCVFRV